MNVLFRILHSKKGSSLVIVIVVFAVVMILGTAILTIASYSYDNSIYYHNLQQAKYTARSVMDTVMAQLDDTATCAKLSEKLQTKVGGVYPELSAKVDGITVDGSTDKTMGKAEVKMQYIDNADPKKVRVKVTVTATVKDAVAKLEAYLKKGKGSRMNPMDFALFAEKGISFGSNDTIAKQRTTYIKGSTFQMQDFMMINMNIIGNFVIRGSLAISGGETGVAHSYIRGKVIAQGGGSADYGTIEGRVYSNGAFHDRGNEKQGRPVITDIANSDFTIGDMVGFGVSPEIEKAIRYLGGSYVQGNSYKWDFMNGVTYCPDINAELRPVAVISLPESIYLNDGTVISGWNGIMQYVLPDSAVWMPLPLGTHTISNVTIQNSATACNIIMSDGNIFDLKNKKLYVYDDSSTPVLKATITLDRTLPTTVEYKDEYNITRTDPLSDVIISSDGKVKRKDSIPELTPSVMNSIKSTIIDPATGVPKEVYRITSDYRITNSYPNILKDKNIVFDTSAHNKDINLYIFSSILDLGTNAKLMVEGSKDVLMFLEAVTRLSAGSDSVDPTKFCEIGNPVDGSEGDGIQFFIIGKGAQVDLQGRSTAHAIIYLPTGIYSETGGATGIKKVVGSVTANRIQITRGNIYEHKDLLNETLLDATLIQNNYFIYPKLSANQINWTLDYYGK